MGHEETFGGDEDVHSFACGDAFKGVYVHPVHHMYPWNAWLFESQLYLNAVAKIKTET